MREAFYMEWTAELYQHYKSRRYQEPFNSVMAAKKWVSRYTYYKITREQLVKHLIILKVPTLMLVELMDELDQENDSRRRDS